MTPSLRVVNLTVPVDRPKALPISCRKVSLSGGMSVTRSLNGRIWIQLQATPTIPALIKKALF